MLTIDHFCLHLVVDAHITAHRLFIVLELHFNLLGGHISSSLTQGILIHVTVFVTAHLLLDIESLLLLQVEVFDCLVVLSIVALIRLWLRMLHGRNLLSGRRYLLLLGHLKVWIATQTLSLVCLETLQFSNSLLPLLFQLLDELHILFLSVLFEALLNAHIVPLILLNLGADMLIGLLRCHLHLLLLLSVAC